MATTEVDAVDYAEDEEIEEEDEPMDEGEGVPAPKLKSTIAGGAGAAAQKKKGRGFKDPMDVDRTDRYTDKEFESLESGGPGPQRSVEGWIVLVTGVHEEANEDDIHEMFAEYGEIKNLHLNLDRRTGFVKGYALIEFETKPEAQAAIDNLDDAELLTQKVHCSWAFSSGPLRRRAPGARRGDGRRGGDRPGRRY
eukprot:TRINITY_DN21638_c0_g1_i1.p1 TRINITY_DN21638_c0_g1~~TRINITY_DN21638_c0_g1_i1.p1  ORF type:complete len:220 (+),score=52.29 TRINITY_DN21638_c0_g1_i1:76-660(+)